jgi:hypothetical protein
MNIYLIITVSFWCGFVVGFVIGIMLVLKNREKMDNEDCSRSTNYQGKSDS